MSNDYRSPAFKKWLDKLQQESWQLELIISGFAIYALILAYEPIGIKLSAASSSEQSLYTMAWIIVFFSWWIFIFNLTLHIILRGLWIGALGLRYVSGDIDYAKLNYSEKFTKYLKKRVGSFDKYIAKLENYCSVLFAISFLVFFYLLGFITILLTITGLVKLFAEISFLSESTREIISNGIAIILAFLSLLTFIDFIGRGILKKNKWISKIYFPIYWIFSFLTLSFLYRPLVYNFLDNKFGRKISLMLIPFYAGIIVLTSVDYQNSNYILINSTSSEVFLQDQHYDDLLTNEAKFAKIASIPSKVISTTYLKVFLIYSEKIEDQILKANKNLKPTKDLRGYRSDMVTIKLNSLSTNEEKSLLIKYLLTLNDLYKLKIDSLNYDADFIISKNQKDKIGFESYLNIRELTEGKHILRILSPPQDSTKITQDTLVTIPFWYYKN